MALPSGAHISIDDILFQVYENPELPFPYYSHNLEPLFVGRQDITGKPGRQNIRPDILLWAQDDWSGGEGNLLLDPDEPSTYYKGTGNVRDRGRLKGRPQVDTDALLTLTGGASTTTEGKDLTTHAGSPFVDSNGSSDNNGAVARNNVRLIANNDEVKVPTHDPADGNISVAFYLENTSAGYITYFTKTGTATYTTVSGTPVSNSPGQGVVLDIGEEVKIASRIHAGGASVTVQFYAFDLGYPSTPSPNYTFRVRNETDATDVATSTASILGQEDYYTTTFTATAGKTYAYYIKCNSGGSMVGVVKYEQVVDSDPTYTVLVRNTTDSTDTVSSSGTVSGAVAVELNFTAVAGKSYEYRVKNTDAGPDTLVVDKIVETPGTSYTAGEVHTAETRGGIWVGFANVLAYSTDGKTWTTRGLSTITANYSIAGLAADDDYLYILAVSQTTYGAATSIEILRTDGSTSGANWATSRMTGPTAGSSFPARLALAPSTRRIYVESVAGLTEYDVTAAASWVGTTVHATATANTTVITAMGIVAVDDNSVCYFRSKPGRTVVYQYKNGAARALWFLPPGFTGRAIAYNQGILLMVGGDPLGDNPGISIHALPMRTEQPVFVGTFRNKGESTLYPTAAGPSTRGNFLIGDSAGRVYEFNPELISLSLIDEPADGVVNALTSYQNYRISASGTSASTVTTNTYLPDWTSGYSTFSVEGGRWDFDIPEAEKVLHGFTVVTEPIVSGQTVSVYYATDGSSAYTLADTYSTAGGTKTFLTVDPTVFFTSLQVRVDGDQGTALTSPEVLSVTARASLNEKVETWDLVLRVFHESSAALRPSEQQRRAQEIRDALLDLASTGAIVTYKDGYRKENGESTTHTVVVEDPQDVVVGGSEGYLRVRLRSVSG